MKVLAMALGAAAVLGPLGVPGVGYAVAGAVLAVGLVSLGSGVAALRAVPVRRSGTARRR